MGFPKQALLSQASLPSESLARCYEHITFCIPPLRAQARNLIPKAWAPGSAPGSPSAAANTTEAGLAWALKKIGIIGH